MTTDNPGRHAVQACQPHSKSYKRSKDQLFRQYTIGCCRSVSREKGPSSGTDGYSLVAQRRTTRYPCLSGISRMITMGSRG